MWRSVCGPSHTRCDSSLVAVLLVSAALLACSHAACSGTTNYDCSNQSPKLTAVPSGIPTVATVLLLNTNAITTIPTGVFPGLRSLQVL
eukprot:m.160482 g.160482  ORF g.160482 m.160482 type:complete len:89 (-) comp15188_c0_seq1:1326-1592(-)